MDLDTDRRRVLALAGTGTAASLAGCSALQGATDSPDSTDTTPDGTSDSQETVVVAVQADQQKLQQRQQKIQSDLQAGNISRSEAQKQFRTVQNQLRSKAVTSFKQRTNSNSGLTINGSVNQFGILLVSGPATTLINSLTFPEVNGLLPEDTFQQAKSQVEQQNGTSTSAN